MKTYELVFILKPNLIEKDQKSEIKKLEELITGFKGKVTKKDIWGKKRLSYPIQKFNEGIYLQFDLNFPEDKIKEWEVKMKLEEKVIRYLLIRKGE